MATLSYNDILKRDNVRLFCDRVNMNKSFLYMSGDGKSLQCTGKTKINNIHYELTCDSLVQFIKTRKSTDHLEVEIQDDSQISHMRPSFFFKDNEFGGRPAKSSEQGSERQEIGMLKILNDPLYQNLVIDGIGCRFLHALKKEGLNAYEKEPYADIVLRTQCNNVYGISMKGESAPSLAGGGLAGLKHLDPDMVNSVYSSVISYYQSLNYFDGDVIEADAVQDLYYKIPIESIRTILTGTAEMGGPVHFLYIGKMDVKAEQDGDRLKFNGRFYSIDEYLNKTEQMYIRVRKREIDDSRKFLLNFSEMNREGYPVILKTYSTRQNSLRFVMTDDIPKNGIMI